MDPESRDWIRSRPACLHATMVRLPPGCLVRATVPLVCPGEGKTARLVSYCEPDDEGKVQVSVLGDSNLLGEVRAYCDAAVLEPVEYLPGVTPEDVRMALGEAVA